MNKPHDISLGKGWSVIFEDAENPVYIEYHRMSQCFGASLGYFEENYGTSVDEFDAPQSVIDKFHENEDIIYEWENDYYERNPRDS
jgi:hypothetical protein